MDANGAHAGPRRTAHGRATTLDEYRERIRRPALEAVPAGEVNEPSAADTIDLAASSRYEAHSGADRRLALVAAATLSDRYHCPVLPDTGLITGSVRRA